MLLRRWSLCRVPTPPWTDVCCVRYAVHQRETFNLRGSINCFTARASEADREGKLETLRWAIKHKYAHPAALEEVEGDAAVRPE